MSTTPKKPRGRPRTAENTTLVAALIARQDALSRRAAGKIEQILRTHVSLEGAAITWRALCREARAGLGAIPDRALARIPNLGAAGHAVLEREIAGILDEMDGGADDGAPLPAIAPQETPPAVTTSTTLPEARAQAANLAVALMNLRARIVRDYRGPRQRKGDSDGQ